MFALVTLLLAGQAEATCRALALEGGGDKGAYQVGAIQALVENLPPVEVAYNFITGVSAGALNACMMSQFAQGNETAAAAKLRDSWLNAPVSTLLQQWPGGYIQGLFENSLFDGGNMLTWVESLVTQAPLRNVTVGSTNEDLGIFQDFNETIGYDDFVVSCLASSAFPVFLPNRELLGYTMMDGGCIINIDVFTAVEQCLSITGGDESQVIVDSVLLSGSYVQHVNAANFTTWEVMDRTRSITSADSYIWYLYNAMLAYPGVNFRYTILPTTTLPGGLIPLNFNQKDMLEMMAMGVSDAEKIIAGNSVTLDVVNLYMGKRTTRRPYSSSR